MNQSKDIKIVTFLFLGILGALLFALRVGADTTQYRCTTALQPVIATTVTWALDGAHCNNSATPSTLQRDLGVTDSHGTELYDGDHIKLTDNSLWTLTYTTDWYLTNGTTTLALAAPDILLSVEQGSVVPVDYLPPIVSIVAPTAPTISGTVQIVTQASDDIGITKIELYTDNVLTSTGITGNITPATYTFIVVTNPAANGTTLANGSHTFTAIAYDASGKSSSTTYTTTVNNLDTTPPTTAITFPLNVISGKAFHLKADASDNVSVKRVEFYLNTTLVFSQSVAPYDSIFDTTKYPNGTYTLTTKAYDAAGNVTVSSPVSVVIKN